MRILFISIEAGLGGAERCLLELISSLPLTMPGAEPRVLSLANGPLVDKLRDLGVPVTVFPLPGQIAELGESSLQSLQSLHARVDMVGRSFAAAFAGAWILPRLRRAILAEQPSLLYSNGNKTHLLLALLGFKAQPTIWHLHDFLSRRPIAARALRLVSHRATAAIANSLAVADDARTHLGGLTIYPVHNGIDTDVFRPGIRDLFTLGEEESKETQPVVRIGMIATYARWKGQRLFMEAIASQILRTSPVHTRYYLIGGPVYRVRGSQFSERELEDISESLGIRERLTLLPFQDSLSSFYRALDIVVHASTEPEPFGRVLIEGMASGKAVIAADAGAVREIVTDGRDGVLFPPGDSNSLARAIREVVENDSLRASLGREARKTAQARFSQKRYVSDVVRVLRHVLRSESATAPPPLIVAMGYQEDGWHSMRNTCLGLFDALAQGTDGNSDTPLPILHSPRCGHRPRALDRRVRYGRGVPTGRTLCLMDHSYGDSILSVRPRFDQIAVLIHDIAFWRTRTSWNSWARARIRAGLAMADCRIVVSHAVEAEVRRELGLGVDAVIPPGIRIDRFSHRTTPRNAYRLLHVGGVAPRKGVDRLIRLLRQLPERYELYRVGEPLTEDLKRLCTELGVSDRVHDLGYVKDEKIADQYSRAGLVLVPSRYEGFGIPAVEARLSGTPVIVSEAVPAYELLTRDEGTNLVEMASLDRTEPDSLYRFLADQVVALSGRIIPLAERERFGWEAVGKQYQMLFAKLGQETRGIRKSG